MRNAKRITAVAIILMLSSCSISTFGKFQADEGIPRFIQVGETTRKEVLETFNKIDIALDPFPFQGNTSTCEAVWMGVPVITLKGNRYLFHFGESINSNLNMNNWIADNKNDYIKKAIEFSSDLNKLKEIRINLREKALRSPVFNAERFSRYFSEMLWSMWNKLKK